MIEIKNIEIKYNERCILKTTDLTIPEGKITMILGVSGSGKSALLYRLGLINQSREFQYNVDGIDINHLTQKEKEAFIKQNIGYVLQTKNLIEYTVYSNIEYAHRLINEIVDEEQIRNELMSVGLENEISQNVDSLSEGQKQRLAILCAVIKKPRILILDEPTSALDKDNSINILNIMQDLSKNGCTIIFTCHQLFAQNYADQIYLIEDQKLKLIKNSEENKLKIKEEKRKKKDSIFYYIRSFIRRYKLRCSILIGVLSIVFAGFTFAISYHDHLLEKGIRQFTGENTNQVLLISRDNEKLYAKLKSDQYVKSVYPYYECEFEFANQFYSVFPMFDENDYSYYYINNRNLKEKDGTFLSYELFKDIEGENTRHLILQNNGKDFVLSTDGTMNSSLRSCFVEVNERAFYMYYADLDPYLNKETMDGVIVFLNSIKDYSSFIDQYDVLEVYTCTQKTTVVDAFYTSFNNYRNNLLMVVCTFISGILLLMEFNYLSVRKNEFSIMRINGIETKSIQKILLYENLIQIVISTLISMVLFIGAYYICVYLDWIITSINYVQSFQIMMILAVIIFILITIENIIYLHMLDPERVLRD